MEITPVRIRERIRQLEAERDNLLAQMEQAKANLNALDGAIQDCNYWLTFLEAIAQDGRGP